MPTPVIIDTDPGIDDAVAILYALRSPAFQVLGLTTVAGNISLAQTTANAGRILALAGADLDVISGASQPLSRAPFAATDVHGNDGLGGVAFPDPVRAPRSGAVDWLADTLRAHPAHSIDLLVLGPMTNIAHLIAQDPDAAARVRRIIAMGGAIKEHGNVGPSAEFNMAADPEAAQAVFASGLPITLIPLDVTRRVRATRTETKALRSSDRPQARAAGDLIEAYFLSTDGGDSRPLHDPCVMLYLEAPALFDIVQHTLRVDLSPPRDGGALHAGPYAVDVAMQVDGPKALALLMDRLMA